MRKLSIKTIKKDEDSDFFLDACEKGNPWHELPTLDDGEPCCACGVYTSCRDATPDELNALDIAYMADQWAENINCHALVGLHACIAQMIMADAGQEAADKIMLRIAKRGGLYGIMMEDEG